MVSLYMHDHMTSREMLYAADMIVRLKSKSVYISAPLVYNTHTEAIVSAMEARPDIEYSIDMNVGSRVDILGRIFAIPNLVDLRLSASVSWMGPITGSIRTLTISPAIAEGEGFIGRLGEGLTALVVGDSPGLRQISAPVGFASALSRLTSLELLSITLDSDMDAIAIIRAIPHSTKEVRIFQDHMGLSMIERSARTADMYMAVGDGYSFITLELGDVDTMRIRPHKNGLW